MTNVNEKKRKKKLFLIKDSVFSQIRIEVSDRNANGLTEKATIAPDTSESSRCPQGTCRTRSGGESEIYEA